MSRTEYKAISRAKRVMVRRQLKQANRETSWLRWAAGMMLLKSILAEKAGTLRAMAEADWKTERLAYQAD